jgi:hypothetical protein
MDRLWGSTRTIVVQIGIFIISIVIIVVVFATVPITITLGALSFGSEHFPILHVYQPQPSVSTRISMPQSRL